MTADKFLEYQYGIITGKEEKLIHPQMLIKAMEEYGKYCAEQALLYFNGNEVGHIEVNEWWSEFIGKEDSE